MSISVVIFDLDGTLIDSATDLAHAVNGMLGAYGRAPLALAEIRAMIGDGMGRLVERALAARGLSQIDPLEAQRSMRSHYAADPVRATVPYPGARAALEQLQAAKLRLAICTNKPTDLAAAVLERLGLAPFFSRLVGGDSLPFRKPDPRVLHSLLADFAAEPREALMVGDSEVDAAAAEAAGMPLVLMRYGYHRGPLERMTHLAALDRLEELPALVAAHNA
jgi:phosphoglycolate phosphatase